MFCKTKKNWSFFEVLARCEVWYWSRNIYLKTHHYGEMAVPPALWLTSRESVSPRCWRVGGWRGRLLLRASPSAISSSLQDYSPWGKRAKLRSILAPVCLGVFSSGKHSVKEIIDWKQMDSRLLCSPCREFRHNVRRRHHQTTDLGRQITRTSFEFQVADPRTRVQRRQTSQWQLRCARSHYVSCRLLRSTE